MPLDFVLDPAHRLVRSFVSGSISEAETRTHYNRMQKAPGFELTFRQLCDMRQATELHLSAAFLKELASRSIFAPGTRRAFVAPNDLHYGLSRMLQTFCEHEGSEVGVFRSMEEAEAWLSLPPAGGGEGSGTTPA